MAVRGSGSLDSRSAASPSAPSMSSTTILLTAPVMIATSAVPCAATRCASSSSVWRRSCQGFQKTPAVGRFVPGTIDNTFAPFM